MGGIIMTFNKKIVAASYSQGAEQYSDRIANIVDFLEKSRQENSFEHINFLNDRLANSLSTKLVSILTELKERHDALKDASLSEVPDEKVQVRIFSALSLDQMPKALSLIMKPSYKAVSTAFLRAESAEQIIDMYRALKVSDKLFTQVFLRALYKNIETSERPWNTSSILQAVLPSIPNDHLYPFFNAEGRPMDLSTWLFGLCGKKDVIATLNILKAKNVRLHAAHLAELINNNQISASNVVDVSTLFSTVISHPNSYAQVSHLLSIAEAESVDKVILSVSQPTANHFNEALKKASLNLIPAILVHAKKAGVEWHAIQGIVADRLENAKENQATGKHAVLTILKTLEANGFTPPTRFYELALKNGLAVNVPELFTTWKGNETSLLPKFVNACSPMFIHELISAIEARFPLSAGKLLFENVSLINIMQNADGEANVGLLQLSSKYAPIIHATLVRETRDSNEYLTGLFSTMVSNADAENMPEFLAILLKHDSFKGLSQSQKHDVLGLILEKTESSKLKDQLSLLAKSNPELIDSVLIEMAVSKMTNSDAYVFKTELENNPGSSENKVLINAYHNPVSGAGIPASLAMRLVEQGRNSAQR